MSGENQQTDVAELERLTNEEEGWQLETEQPSEQPTEQPQAQTETPTPTVEPQEVKPEVPPQAVENKSAGIPDEVLKVLEETPFKSVPDVVKAYKNSQSEYTKLHERVKPYEQLIEDVQKDVNFRQFIEQATQLYRNPELAQAYAQQHPVQNNGVPNPQNYDFSTYEGIEQFQKDIVAHTERTIDARLNTRLSAMEQKSQQEQMKLEVEKAKLELRQKYPDSDPEDVLKFIGERQGKWTFEDAYKIKMFDTVEQRAYEKAKKEIVSKANEASKNTPVASAPSDKPVLAPTEVITYVQRYGLESANKKWGVDKVKFAIQKFTEENDI